MKSTLLPEEFWLEDAPASLPEGAAHVWGAVVSEFQAALPELAAVLTPEEQARAGRFRFEEDRNRYLVAHGLLRLLLTRALSVPPALLPLGALASGKPVLRADGGPHPLRFNLSHSGELVLIALAWDREVGVDVERAREGLDAVPIVRRFFTANEASAFERLPPDQQAAAFYCAWTRKEAFIKARGETLARALQSFEVSFDPAHPSPLLRRQPPTDDLARWQIYTLPIGPGYHASLALDDPACPVHLHRASPQRGGEREKLISY